ncbi:hypothetical protein GDO86_004816 [Hymenochirus boettgeri]|uniref:Uncharacterized protein n=1 Tax=Hymenochirus boettgeri TaxID=247094 RepID=A0A8T2K6J5_9PIPI|nr:hypothetical protein GDO86_004816 [Hymenochirus boettgeri]
MTYWLISNRGDCSAMNIVYFIKVNTIGFLLNPKNIDVSSVTYWLNTETVPVHTKRSSNCCLHLESECTEKILRKAHYFTLTHC